MKWKRINESSAFGLEVQDWKRHAAPPQRVSATLRQFPTEKKKKTLSSTLISGSYTSATITRRMLEMLASCRYHSAQQNEEPNDGQSAVNAEFLHFVRAIIGDRFVWMTAIRKQMHIGQQHTWRMVRGCSVCRPGLLVKQTDTCDVFRKNETSYHCLLNTTCTSHVTWRTCNSHAYRGRIKTHCLSTIFISWQCCCTGVMLCFAREVNWCCFYVWISVVWAWSSSCNQSFILINILETRCYLMSN